MLANPRPFLALLLAVPALHAALAADVTSHALKITVDAAEHRVRGSGRLALSVPADASAVDLWLGADFALDTVRAGERALTPAATSAPRPGRSGAWTRWTVPAVSAADGRLVLDVEWSGAIRSPGALDAAGMVLRAADGWYPTGDQRTSRFTISATVPAAWRVIAPGQRTGGTEPAGGARTENYDGTNPLESLDLAAAPWNVAEGRFGDTRIAVFTLADAPSYLAPAVVTAVSGLLERYTREFGPHAWPQFLLAEDPRAAGLAGPSFAVLAPSVLRANATLRFPLSHAVVHDWWGYGVYVDRGRGDWSEGLATYYAEQAFAAEAAPGGDVDFRRRALLDYAEFAAQPGRDRPLSVCGDGHAAADRALVQGKALMVFQMLRREVGDDLFRDGLRAFYAAGRYRPSTWADLADVFSRLVRQSLSWFFEQWIDRAGAPEVQFVPGSATVHAADDELRVSASLAATPGWILRVPVELQGVSDAGQRVRRSGVGATGARDTHVRVSLRAPLVRSPQLVLDPDVDLFRLLDPREVPPVVATVLGGRLDLVVLGTGRGTPPDTGARNLAELLRRGAGIVRTDREIDEAALARAERVIVIGRPAADTATGRTVIAGLPAATALGDQSLRLAGRESQEADAALCIVMPHGTGRGRGLVLLDGLNPGSLLALGRRLPEYVNSSYVLVTGAGALVNEMAAAPWSPVLPLEAK